jgi:hypothetical protein
LNKDIFPGNFEILSSGSSSVSEIFSNEFDVTWHDSYRRNNSDQRVWGLIEGENAQDDGTVSYHYNKDYFRSDDFKSEHIGKHILFAGCSETEGQGGNIEDSWGKILFNKISSDASGFYNIGKSGYGWQKIISQIRIYTNRYGKPENLFVLLPNIGRSIEWSNKEKDWYAKQSYPQFDSTKRLDGDEDMYVSEQSAGEYKKTFIDFVISWRLFEDFCEAAGIKLVWGTWEPIDNYNFSQLNLFNNFIPLPKDDILSIIDQYRKDAKLGQFDLDKRDGHHGRLFHEYWADRMLAEAIRKGFIND